MGGDWQPADKLELEFLNTDEGPKPYVMGDFVDAIPDGEYESARAVEIHRSTEILTDDGRVFGLRVTWAVAAWQIPQVGWRIAPCAACDTQGCVDCGDSGYVVIGDPDARIDYCFLIDTDIDGAVIAQGEDGRWRHV